MVAKTERLSAEAWVNAAFAALIEEGPSGVRIEALARRLAVTKGSFYWHFKNHRALMDAVLLAWEQAATELIIDAVEAAGGDAEQKLSHLMKVCFQATKTQADSLESAIRSLGKADPVAAKTLAQVDRRRLSYVAKLLRACGLSRDIAAKRSRILYLVMIGDFTMTSHGGPRTTRAEVAALQEMVLSRVR